MQSDLITRQPRPTQSEIDISNLRFYAELFREHKWETQWVHWSVFVQTLTEVADRIAGLVAERDAALAREAHAKRVELPGTYVRCMSGHYYAETRGDEECPICKVLADARECEKRLSTALLYMKREYAAFGSLSQETQNMAAAALAKENTPHA